MTEQRPIEALNALCPDNQVQVTGAATGSLADLTFAVKDVFDIEGTVTGNGHPDWLRTHSPAQRHAEAVARLLSAGAALIGRTISDELAYSLTGENAHYGTPVNPADPSRVPGGSSSGSASVAAAGAVDFALGSDCGGSVRVPASYCGILGMRPTHGRVPMTGAVPFAPSFDCAGWFARDTEVFAAVGRVLLDDARPAEPIRRLVIARDGFALLDPSLRVTLDPVVAALCARMDEVEEVQLAEPDLDAWSAAFRTLQAAEVWDSVGPWIERVRPKFGPGVSERLDAARRTGPDEVAAANEVRAAVRTRLDGLLMPGTALVLPTVPRVAPERGLPAAEIEIAYRHLAMNLLCPAGLAGLPQISMPLAYHGGLPIGLSILGRRGSDIDLVTLACDLVTATATV